MLLPDHLKRVWSLVEASQLSLAVYEQEERNWLDDYARTWQAALILPGHDSLETSLVSELAEYLDLPADEVRRRSKHSTAKIRSDWESTVDAADGSSVERFYDRCDAYLYELMWWHTLSEDTSPLAYVLAFKFAKQQKCSSYLDLGSGVGSGALLFARNGFQVTLAEISSPLLDFSRWRFKRRHIEQAAFLDVKQQKLPAASFDVITAMDVFEHLADPVSTVEEIASALKPGGFLFGRFHADEDDEDRPQHIVTDFQPTFQKLYDLGFRKVWEDGWYDWGHQVFQKAREQEAASRRKRRPQSGAARGR